MATNNYYNGNNWNAIDIMEDIMGRDISPISRFHVAMAAKYILRAGKKPDAAWTDDVYKAMNYLNRALYGEWLKKD